MEQDFVTEREQRKVSEQNRQEAAFPTDTVQAQTQRAGISPPLMEASVLAFPKIACLLFDNLASESNRRVYRNTFQQWELFALRNVELDALRWEDVNRDLQTIAVCRDHKGQVCDIPILDVSLDTINALRRLQDTQISVFSDHDILCKHIFPALSTGKEARFKPDKNVRASTQTIRNIVKRTGEKAGLGNVAVPDLHYTSSTVFPRAGASATGDPSSADSWFTRNGESHETFNHEEFPSTSAGNRAEG